MRSRLPRIQSALLILILLFAFPVGLLAQEAAPAPSAAGQKCSISGVVVRAGTSEPLRKARVTLRKSEARSQFSLAANTDAAGRFTLKDIEPGRYRLFVERNGYVRQEYGQRTPGRQGSLLTLSAGQNLRDLTFKMVPSAVITGRVYDEDGEPLPGVEVQALRWSYVRGRRDLLALGFSATNDLGEYRIFGLSPGRYILRANATRFGGRLVFEPSDGDGSDEAYAPSYYPGTSDASRAQTLEVKAGEELRHADFTFVPVRAVRVRGRVAGIGPVRPGGRAQVMLFPRDTPAGGFMMRNSVVVEDSEGRFELRGVVPGSYVLMAMMPEEGRMYSARMAVEVGGADVEGVTLALGPGLDVSGVLRFEGAAAPESEPVRVGLTPRDESVFFSGGGDGRVAADGTFLLRSVPEGSFSVQVFNLPANFYLKEVRLGGEDVLESGLELAVGKAGARLELVVSAAGAQVDGMVVNEDSLPVSGATVVAVPEGKRRSLRLFYKTVSTDQYGRFSIKGLTPGEYKIFAWEEIEPGEYLDTEFLKPYEERGARVQLAEAAVQTLELKVIPAAPAGN